MFMTSVLVGILAGGLAGSIADRGGHGLKADIVLGVVGSTLLSWISWASGVFPDAGIIAMASVAFCGAAIALTAQRTLRPSEKPTRATGTIWRLRLGAAWVPPESRQQHQPRWSRTRRTP